MQGEIKFLIADKINTMKIEKLFVITCERRKSSENLSQFLKSLKIIKNLK